MRAERNLSARFLLWNTSRCGTRRCRSLNPPRCLMADQVRNMQIGIYRPPVDNAVRGCAFEIHLTRTNRLLFALLIVEIDAARYHCAHQDPRMAVPPAISAR